MAGEGKDNAELEQQLAQATARIAELEAALLRRSGDSQESIAYQQMEAAYRRISGILDSITECHFAMDRQYRLTAANQRAAEYLGQPREPLLGRVPWEIHPHLADSPITHLLQKAMTQQVPVHDEAASWFNPGRWLELHVYPSAQGLELYARDVTDRKQLEQALRESEQRQRVVFDNAPMLIFLKDMQTRYLLFNRQGEIWSGVKREEIVGRTDYEVLPQEMADRFAVGDRQALQAGGPIEIEELVPHGDGQMHPHITIKFPLLDAAGQPYAMGGVSIDLTRQKQYGQQLTELNQTLEQRVADRSAEAERRAAQLQRLAGELTRAEQRERQRLAEVLHDNLQQLLVAARLKVHHLLKRLKDNHADASMRQVAELLKESISVSRSLTAELSPPVLHQPDFGRVLHWLAQWMHDRHSLHVLVRDDGPVHLQSGDIRLLLFQAVRELLFNVVKHAHTDQASLEMTQGQQQVRVIVADEGSGFEAAELHADPSSSRFGLFSLGERLELLGGQMAIDSQPGRGTRVTLIIPDGQSSSGSNSMVGSGNP